MSDTFNHLLSPFTMGKVTFKNRFAFLPHHTGYGTDLACRAHGLSS